jgi:hypothetical protein
VRLWLTDAGRALQRPVEAKRAALEDRLTRDLGAADQRQLLDALATINRAAGELLGRPVDPRDPERSVLPGQQALGREP